MTRHSHQDALSEQQYERLLDACDELDEPYQTEARFAIVVCGRLGLRGGELAHLSKSWVDFDKQVINIPAYQDCNCGYCRQQAELRVTNADGELTLDDAMAERWNPKTSHAVRCVPFDFDDRVQSVVSGFFWTHDDGWSKSRSTVNRCVKRAAEHAGLDIYPHALRATAATYHAYRNVPAPALMSLMGWADLATAMKYIRLSGGATQKALLDAHQR